MRTWRHSGFHVYCGPVLQETKEVVTVGLHIVRAPAAASRLVPGDGPNLTYLPKNIVAGLNDNKLFSPPGETYDYLEWIARLTLHIPEQSAQTVHYYGAYSNAHRGLRGRAWNGRPASRRPLGTAVRILTAIGRDPAGHPGRHS